MNYLTWMIHTGSRYHTQDTGYYCGAASAMMILAEIGVSYNNLDQDDLYTDIHNNNAQTSGWASDPYGVRHVLIDRRPSGFVNTFVVHKPLSEVEGTRDIVYTLHKYEVSPAVLVYNCRHWLVVPGVETDVEPVSGASYTVQGFWLHNPVHYSSSPPPPHNATDNCGTGGSLGVSNEFVTYANWQSLYFTGCDYDDPSGNSQFISVCDPDVRDINLPLRREKKYLSDGKRILNPDQAIKLCEQGLDDYNLFESKRTSEVLRGSKPIKPLLVQRLDRLNSYYYIIPRETSNGVVAFTQIDARFGLFQGLRLLERPLEMKIPDKENILKQIAFKNIRIEEKSARVKIFPEALCIPPALVWQPCWESWSPHLPFYQVNVGGYVIYVRIDGEIFTHLTTSGKGV